MCAIWNLGDPNIRAWVWYCNKKCSLLNQGGKVPSPTTPIIPTSKKNRLKHFERNKQWKKLKFLALLQFLVGTAFLTISLEIFGSNSVS